MICIMTLAISFCSKRLVINYGEGGLQNGREGQVKSYPYKKKRGGGSHAEGGGGHKQF